MAAAVPLAEKALSALGPFSITFNELSHFDHGKNGVVLIASSHDVGRPRAGVAAYSASKAALDEILHSWRSEHPELSILRVGIGPTEGTEILRGADRDLLAQLFDSWVEQGQLPERMSALQDVANTVVSLVTTAHENPSVVTEYVQLAPRIKKVPTASKST